MPTNIRVVSLLPSATEMLCALPGGREMLVGRSHECDYPASIGHVPVLTMARTAGASSGGVEVGRDSAAIDAAVRAALASGESLYTLDGERLAALKPDVILTQDLCRVCSIDVGTVRRLAASIGAGVNVVSLNAETIEGVFDDLVQVGVAVGLEREATRVVVGLRERMYVAAEFATPFVTGPSVAFLEWTDPLFVGGHWVPQLIERAGGVHPLNPTEAVSGAGAGEGPIGATQRRAGKSVTLPREVLVASRPERVIVCPCGVGLEGAIVEAQRLLAQEWFVSLPASRAGHVVAVDGNQMFSRPGPRLVDAFEWLVGWLNDRPERMPPGFPWRALKRSYSP
jgi:ABC-type Fe3+-hydroxamate transport system substrate-binding protein